MKLGFRSIIFSALACVCVNAAAHGDDVVLRSAARLPAGANQVVLSDIAELNGPYASTLGDVVITKLTGPSRVIELNVPDVRRALDDAGVHWGKIDLQGGRVVIRPRMQSNTEAPMAMQTISLTRPEAEPRDNGRLIQHRLVSEFADEATVRGAIGSYIAKGLRLPTDALQLAFDSRDKELLDITTAQYRIEVEAVSSLRSDRIQMVVRLWTGMRIDQNVSLTVLPLVRSDAVIAAKELGEGVKLTASDLMIEQQWVSPSRSGWFTSVAELNDRVLDRSVRAGERLAPKHLRKDIIIRRGDRAIVRCLVGGIVLSLEVEARQEGAEGELIEFRKLGERDTFFATVTAPGEAVMDLSNPNNI